MIIVTGSAGFIGSALVWELNQKGHSNIVCVDLFREGSKWRNLLKSSYTHFVLKQDIFEYLEQPEVLNSVKAIFHLGACSSTTEKNMDFLVENNFHYSQKLFRWCAKNQKKFIYASSAATYGAGENGYDDQTAPEELRPLNPYGYSKLLFDRWVLRQTQAPPQWVGLKFFNVFGPNEYHKGDMASVVFKAFYQIQQNGKLRLFKSYRPDYKDGEQKRDFVYVKDVTRWMVEIFEKNISSGIYNIGFGEARTWLDLANAVFKSMDKPVQVDMIDMPDHVKNQYQYFTEAKLNKLLNSGLSQPQWPLEVAIQDYVKNYLEKEDSYL